VTATVLVLSVAQLWTRENTPEPLNAKAPSNSKRAAGATLSSVLI
jgi:hypothetical protein